MLNNIDKILKENNLLFKSKILVTERHLYNKYKQKLDRTKWTNIFFIKGCDIGSVLDLEERFKKTNVRYSKNVIIIGFGGGRIIDATKYFATRNELNYLTVPSTLSNDGIYSPVAIIEVDGKKKRFGVKCPLGIICDLDVIGKSPKIDLLAGIGDLLSNISALEDYKLAERKKGENVNDFAYSLSYFAVQPVLNYPSPSLGDYDFLKLLAYGLVMSGLAMEISGDSRPASGSEHLISHAIDELYPKRATLHGIQVAFGCLYVEKNFRKKNYQLFYDFFKKVGLIEAIEEKVNFSESEMRKILERSVEIRDRYALLNEYIKGKG